MVPYQHKDLWHKIENFSIDDANDAFPFSAKLASENNWTLFFTQRAIEEYKKFIFLCCISPNGASPSDIIDKVWHLHLTYTTNYWIDLCRDTLRRDIHHHPSKGGLSEKIKHDNWYADTLVLYLQTFGYTAREDIWPKEVASEISINEDIYEPDVFNNVCLIFLVAAGLFVLAFKMFDKKGPEFLFYYAILCIAGLAVIYALQKHKEKKLSSFIGKYIPQYFNVYHMSRFLYGSHRSYQVALIDLLKKDLIDINGQDFILSPSATIPSDNEQNPLLEGLIRNVKPGNTFSYKEGLGYVDSDKVLHPGFDKLYKFSQKVDYQKFVIPAMVLFVGVIRFLQGMSNEKPVGFLIFEMGIFAIVGLMILSAYSYTQLVFNSVEKIWAKENGDGYSGDILTNAGIIGVAAVANFAEYAILSEVFTSNMPQENKYSNSSSGGCGSSGCSSGGGSSCGGGGCGGCGGGD